MLHSDPKNIQAVPEVLNRENIGSWLEHAGVTRTMQQRFCRTMREA